MTLPTSWATLRRALSMLAAGAALLAAPASATTYVVNSDADDITTAGPVPDGTLTLREAITAANTDAAYGDAPAGTGADLITFAPSVTRIQLTLGELPVSGTLSVSGAVEVGPQLDMRSRIFVTDATASLSLASLTLRDGYTLSDNGGALFLAGGSTATIAGVTFQRNRAVDGGGVYVSAEASLTFEGGALFDGNRATGSGAANGGGGIYTAGDVSGDATTSVVFDENRATVGSGSGGGVLVAPTGTFNATLPPVADLSATDRDAAKGAGWTFTGNRAARAGGGIEVQDGGSVELALVMLTGNVAGPSPGNGGAIHITGAGSVTLTTSTVSGNTAFSEGGGLWNSATGTMTINDVDFTNNVARGAAADNGGGALFSDGGATAVTGGSMSGNSAIGSAGSGGAVFANGASSFSLDGVTITNNTAVRAGGGVEVVGGTLNMIGGQLNGNTTGNSPGNGGGLHITGDGDVSVVGANVVNNTARNEGGGLWNSGAGTLFVTGVTVDGNSVISGNGGGVYQQAGESGTTTITSSTLSNNVASAFGGGLFAEGGTVLVSNSTLSGNAAIRGAGGAAEDAMVSFASSTIAANTSSGRGGGFANPASSNRVLLQNTIVADNAAGTAAVELSGFYKSDGNNIIESLTGAGVMRQLGIGDQFVDPMLGPLADNGGPTFTHALLAGSPAIDAGDTDLVTDQRGEPRVDPDDVGAYDFGAMMAGPGAMVLTGVIDATLTGGTPKAVEVYVTEDISDLGLFGIGFANNGGGTDGEEFSFPDGVSATAGDFLYVASESTQFTTWFGFAPDYTSGNAGINGDDAVELFRDGVVVDVFGEIDTDGTGQPWEYLDGWAYREAGTGPDGTTFVLGNWFFSGPNALDGASDNASADPPFPTGEYDPTPPAARGAFASNKVEAVTGLAPVAPNPIRQTGRVRFTVAESQAVTVELYDMMGRRVQSLYAGTPAAEAVVDVTVDASALASGVYVIVMQSETARETQRVTVAR